MLIQNLNIQDVLLLWGEWERIGRDYTRNMNYSSGHTGGNLPTLNDEEAKWICDKMAIVKRKRITFYRYLRTRYEFKIAVFRMAAFEHVTPREMDKRLAEAEGYVLAVIDGMVDA